MHACIASFSTGVPVYPLAYSRKFNGLFGDTLNYKYYGDLVNANNDEVFDNMKIAFEKRLELKENIQKILETTIAEKDIQLTKLISDEIMQLTK